jgi:NAD(P)-dependent dehydrogenase (short-subunit alcohol dehydrogenase family)
VRQTVATFGRLDAAYNNAGVQNVRRRQPIHRVMTTIASWASTCAECGAA